MVKAEVYSRFTYCGECAFWHPLNAKTLKEEYRGYIGYCDRPREHKVERNRDDFCSRGAKKENDI